MIKSILKLIWKRKRRTSLMIIEMFISFLILFALLTVIIKSYTQFVEPKGFNANDVWLAELRFDNKNDKTGNSIREVMDLLKKNLLALQGVNAVSNCSSNVPYAMGVSSTSMKFKEVQHSNIHVVRTDENFIKAMQLDVADGRWYGEEDEGQEETPIVVNREFKELFFPDESAVGKKMTTGYNDDKYKIVGYVENYKAKGELSDVQALFFRMLGSQEVSNRLLIRTVPGVGKEIEEQLLNTLVSTAKSWTINVKHMDVYKRNDFKRKLIPIIVLLAICVFLVVNIILGLFGTLLYNISRRKSEIGLRRSVGAPALKIYQQFIGEMLMLTTLGIIPAVIVAIQFPILNVFEIRLSVYVNAILFSALIIYLLVFIASYIPSRYAARIQPATALHEE